MLISSADWSAWLWGYDPLNPDREISSYQGPDPRSPLAARRHDAQTGRCDTKSPLYPSPNKPPSLSEEAWPAIRPASEKVPHCDLVTGGKYGHKHINFSAAAIWEYMVDLMGCKLKSRGDGVVKVAQMHDPQPKWHFASKKWHFVRGNDIFWNRDAISSPEHDNSSVKMPFRRWRCYIRRWK